MSFWSKVACYDWDRDGGHDFIGQFTTNLDEMSKAGKPNEVCEISKKILLCVINCGVYRQLSYHLTNHLSSMIYKYWR